MKEPSAIIPLSGINRVESDIKCNNGSIDDIINLRYSNGSYKPIGAFPFFKDSSGNIINVSGHDHFFIHKILDVTNYIIIKDWKPYYLRNGTLAPINIPEYILLQGNVSFSSIGNVAELSSFDNNSVTSFYIFWDGTAYNYISFASLPPFIKLDLEINPDNGVDNTFVTDNYNVNPGRDESAIELLRTLYLGVASKINKVLGNIREANMIYGIFKWMYAVRLYDGSYIQISPVFLNTHIDYDRNADSYQRDYGENGQSAIQNATEIDKYPDNFYTYAIADKKTEALSGPIQCKVWGKISFFDLKFQVQNLSVLKEMKNFILSIDIFMSPPVIPFNTTDDGFTAGRGVEIDFPYLKTKDAIEKELSIKSSLHKIHSINIDEIDFDNNDPLEIKLEEFNLDLLETYDTFDGDFNTYNKIFSNASYIYNSKNHKGNIKEELFGGFSLRFLQHQPFYSYIVSGGLHKVPDRFKSLIPEPDNVINRILTIVCKTYIETQMGISIVIDREDFPDVTSDNYIVNNGTLNMVSPYITYPDTRAYRIDIFVKVEHPQSSTKSHSYYMNSFNLKEDDIYNIAYYLSPDLHPVNFIEIEEDLSPFDLIPKNNIVKRPNTAKVSETENMFTYPSEQTYTIGTGEILGFCANTKAISTGQFGEYPLYAFCSDGIYAMGIGSGEVEYSSIRPVSRDICNNPESITPTDNEIIFSTNRGLLLISGESIQVLSTDIHGLPFNFINGVSKIPLLQKALSNDSLVQLLGSVSTIDFKEYIKKADIGFLYNVDRELVVSNPDYNYSYVYSLTNRIWYKINLKIGKFYANYPSLYASVNGLLLDMTQEKEEGEAETYILTRPIKVDKIKYFRPITAVLRSYIKPVHYSGIYAFGSVDGLVWRFIGGKEYNGAIKSKDEQFDFINLGCDLSRERMRFVRIAYVGKIKYNSSLDYLELTVKAVDDNSQ